jgi:hypothetical protein
MVMLNVDDYIYGTWYFLLEGVIFWVNNLGLLLKLGLLLEINT